MNRTDAKECLRGSITVYCALILLLLVALIGSFLEAAHQTGIRTEMNQAVATGLDSLFSMYDEGLYEEYGLLFLNEDLLEVTATEQFKQFLTTAANPNEGMLVKTPQLLSFQLENVQLTTVYRAVDDQGIFLEREVLELMKYQETASLLNQLKSYIEQITNAEQAYSYVVEQNDSYEETDWEAMAQEAGAEDTDEADEDDEEDEEDEAVEVSQEDIDAALDGSIITQVQELLTDTLLSLFVEDLSEVSEKSKESRTEFGTSHDISQQAGFLQETADNLLYDEYLLQYMGSYIHPSEAGGLQYELEYILGGEKTDRENLLEVVTKLLLTRMALNIVFLLANNSYSQEAEALADALVGWTGLIPLVVVVKLLLIAVWAFCESILDVRALLAGKNIDFYKSRDHWNTGLGNCVTKVAAGEMAAESNSGISYEMYLRIFLLTQNMQKKCLRTMHVIEWNLKKESGRNGFSFAHCIYGVEATVSGIGTPVFSGMYGFVGGEDRGYRYSVNWSRTY